MATMPIDVLRRHRLTVDDYHQMAEAGILADDDRVELIEGEVLDMSPIGSLHAALVRVLARWLSAMAGPRAIVAVQDPIHLDDTSEPQPDIALLTPRTDCYASARTSPPPSRSPAKPSQAPLPPARPKASPCSCRSAKPAERPRLAGLQRCRQRAATAP